MFSLLVSQGQQGSQNIWLGSVEFANLIGAHRNSTQNYIKKGRWRDCQLITREAYGNGDKCREVLLSSLPKEVQAPYFQGSAPLDIEVENERLRDENEKVARKYERIGD